MELLSTAANIAQLLCLPATIAAIPGIVAVFSDRVRNWLGAHQIVPILLIVILIGVVLFDTGARLDLFPHGWFAPKMETIYRRTFQNEVVLLDNKAFVECSFGDNVTLKWNGGPYDVRDTQLRVPAVNFRIATDVRMISDTLGLLNGLHALAPGVTLSLVPLPLVPRP